MPKRPDRSLFQSVLCPVDFSVHSRHALEYAALLAHRDQGTVTALFVNDPLLVAAAAAAYDERALASKSREELGRFVRKALERQAARPQVETLVTMGDPASEILRLAKRIGARIVVLGSEGLSGPPRLFFGSTTARVLGKADVPILAVPKRTSRRPKDDWPGTRVLAAVQVGAHTAVDIAAAAALATWCGAALSIAHVVEPVRLPSWFTRRPAGHEKPRAAAAKTEIEAIAERVTGSSRVDVHVLAGDPATEVIKLARRLRVGLVIVVLRQAPGLLGTRQGQISYRVVCDAATPVLALPSGWTARS